MKHLKTGTFSILAISSDSQSMGVAVASGSPSVGQRVPHAQSGVGVIATQAYTRVAYGIQGLTLLSQGFSPKQALHTLLEEDTNRESRQVGIMDFQRRKANFTGSNVPQFHGKVEGENYLVLGNLLTKQEVVNGMAREFETSSGKLAWKMIRALQAGSNRGGDKRGEKSAALIVVGMEEVELKISVYMHDSPIEELYHHLK
ncbi:MAG: DUF1028 domain-containing protein [Thermoproteota archaeon]